MDSIVYRFFKKSPALSPLLKKEKYNLLQHMLAEFRMTIFANSGLNAKNSLKSNEQSTTQVDIAH